MMGHDFLKRIRRQRGVSMWEYALLVSAIGVVCLITLQILGTQTKDQLQNADTITPTTSVGQPLLSISPNPASLQMKWGTSSYQTFVVTNTGTAQSSLLSGNAEISLLKQSSDIPGAMINIQNFGCTRSLAPGESCTFDVGYDLTSSPDFGSPPTQPITYTGSVSIIVDNKPTATLLGTYHP